MLNYFADKMEDSGKVEIPILLARQLYEESKEFNILFSVAEKSQALGIPTIILTNEPTEEECAWQSTLTDAHKKSSCFTISHVATNAFLKLEKYIQEKMEV